MRRPRPHAARVPRSLREAKSPQVGSQAILRVSRFVKPQLEQGLDPVLRGGANDRSHAGVPPGRNFDVRG